MTVYRITGKRDLVSAAEVTATDLLDLMTREEATHSQARAASRATLNQIARRPNKTISAAVSRLADAFLPSIVDRNRPHQTETIFSSRYVPEDNLAGLMRRLSIRLTPEASERVGDKAIVATHAHKTVEEKNVFRYSP